jgi:hypothetical protein
MTLVVTATITLLALALLFFAARRDITLCELEIARGELVVVRGGISPKVLGDLQDVARRGRIKRGSVRILRAKDRARVEASDDIAHEHLQTLRNVVGSVPLAKLMAGATKPTSSKTGGKRKKKR